MSGQGIYLNVPKSHPSLWIDIPSVSQIALYANFIFNLIIFSSYNMFL